MPLFMGKDKTQSELRGKFGGNTVNNVILSQGGHYFRHQTIVEVAVGAVDGDGVKEWNDVFHLQNSSASGLAPGPNKRRQNPLICHVPGQPHGGKRAMANLGMNLVGLHILYLGFLSGSSTHVCLRDRISPRKTGCSPVLVSAPPQRFRIQLRFR
ncbi:hypothetical protein A9K55_008635 [Cordyceps militaris]|uniref:Uncharacterized protein n=1 Tax=Cordyceps militaris TaxID=73501 RepID=A0A2H4SGL6_CORMI|nr:hypothetical protein A9K55_008635 [Cordyceps militaris]